MNNKNATTELTAYEKPELAELRFISEQWGIVQGESNVGHENGENGEEGSKIYELGED